MNDGDLDLMALPPIKDFAGYDGPLDHPIIMPVPSLMRAEVYVSHDLKDIEINGVFRDGTYSASRWTGSCPELEEQFLFLAELLKDDFKEKCILPFRVGRDKSELREVDRFIPGITGNIGFEVYLHDTGDFGTKYTQKYLANSKMTGEKDDGGLVSASIVSAYGFGELTPVSREVIDVVRIYERRYQISHRLNLMDDEGYLLSLAPGELKRVDAVRTAEFYFEQGYPNVIILNSGRPYNSDATGQMYYYSPETYDL
ncbi:hypothetical protein INCEPTION_50 [Proteus phage vB_PmiS_Inception]|nr:hypothetical protein [Proteus mirabilis]UGO36041.1 hypothetical protein INCEPTION_50 [Proteus phage vB_PmiS_Inception]